jgi:hypothetical protein
MKKVEIETIKEALNDAEIPEKLKSKFLEKLAKLMAADEQEEENEPKAKWSTHLMLLSPEGEPEVTLPDYPYIVKIPETESVYTVERRLQLAAEQFNLTRKGRRYPVRTIADAIEHTSKALFKEQGVQVGQFDSSVVVRNVQIGSSE